MHPDTGKWEKLINTAFILKKVRNSLCKTFGVVGFWEQNTNREVVCL
jgi:hypothetical protein